MISTFFYAYLLLRHFSLFQGICIWIGDNRKRNIALCRGEEEDLKDLFGRVLHSGYPLLFLRRNKLLQGHMALFLKR